MTEAEWLASADPLPMIRFLSRHASDRKVRLFAVACTRRVWASLEHEEFREAVRKVEMFADGLVGEAELLDAYKKALVIFPTLHDGRDNGPGAALATAGFPSPPKSIWQKIADALDDPWWEDEFDKGDRLAPALVTATHAARAAAHLKGERPGLENPPAMIAEYREQAGLVRCLFGNPFRPRPERAAWMSSEVSTLAGAIYSERAFDRMPLLADAMESAGGISSDMIAHCRSGYEHARGCWVIDLLLGKD